MNSAKILSIIVPAYNAEQYLEKCIDSMLVAEVLKSLEILIVDDGAKDKTPVIADDYAKRFPETVRVIHKINGGWGSGVNLGIKEAMGEYFKIVDADDWVEKSNLSALMNELRKLPETVDLIATPYTDYSASDDSYVPHPLSAAVAGKLITEKELFGEYEGQWGFPIHTIIYRTDFLRELNLEVDNKYYTDIEYILLPLPFIRNVYFLDLQLSYYFHGSENQSTAVNGYRKNWHDLVCVAKRLVVFYAENTQNFTDSIKKCLKKNIMGIVSWMYYVLLHPSYVGELAEAKLVLRDFDKMLKRTSSDLYRAAEQQKRRGIPYIKLWRWKINIFRLIK